MQRGLQTPPGSAVLWGPEESDWVGEKLKNFTVLSGDIFEVML